MIPGGVGAPGLASGGSARSLVAVTAVLLALPVPAAVLAHQGGWDEILMVLVPIVVFAGLLVVANRRAAARIADEAAARDETDEIPPTG